MKKIFLVTAFGFICHSTFAMFCPSGFNTINIGDTVEQVTKTCGMPDDMKTTKAPPPQPQEWNYYLQPNPSNPTSLKMSIAFDAHQKVVNITVNGTSVVATPMCGSGNAFKLGDKAEDVKKSCGDPTFINESKSSSAPEIETTTLTYNTTPVTRLVFVGGKLKERN